MTNKTKSRRYIQFLFLSIYCLSIIFSDTLMAFQTREICKEALNRIEAHNNKKQSICTNHNVFFKENPPQPEAGNPNNPILSIGIMDDSKSMIYRGDMDIGYFNRKGFYDTTGSTIPYWNVTAHPASLIISFHTSNNLLKRNFSHDSSPVPDYEASSSVYSTIDKKINAIPHWLSINKTYQQFDSYVTSSMGTTFFDHMSIQCEYGTSVFLLCPYKQQETQRPFLKRYLQNLLSGKTAVGFHIFKQGSRF